MGKITKYERLMNMANKCRERAKNATSPFMVKFYLNAAEGFEKKAKELTIAEACEC